MKHMSFILSFTFLILLTSLSCKKDKNLDADGLPKAKQTGSMVFACKVNGSNWISSNKSRDMGAGVSLERINVFGSIYPTGGFEGFVIQIDNPENMTNFRLDDHNERFITYENNSLSCFNTLGKFKSTDGEVIFTKIDKDKKIISGSFWCDIPTDKCGTLKVTNGRFDISYS